MNFYFCNILATIGNKHDIFKIFKTESFVNTYISFKTQFQQFLTFSAILKLHKFKTNVSVKEKSTFGNTQCVFQYRISLIEKPSEVRTILN